MVTESIHYWQKYGFFGGDPFLDFLNTYDDLGKTRKIDAIADWKTLINWSVKARILNAQESKALIKFPKMQSQPELTKVYILRELGWEVLSKKIIGESINPMMFEQLVSEIKWAFANATMTKNNSHFDWVIPSHIHKTTLIRARLALTAGNLMASPNLAKLTLCNGCTGLFLNAGRGVGRKWCRMKTCGNRAKISKFRSID